VVALVFKRHKINVQEVCNHWERLFILNAVLTLELHSQWNIPSALAGNCSGETFVPWTNRLNAI